MKILITGAASGLGREMALESFKRGHEVYLVDVSDAVAGVAKETKGRYILADLSERSALDRILEWAPDADVLINNASLASRSMFAEMDLGKIEKIARVNILAVMILSRLYLERFRKRGEGTLVNISSSAGYFPTPYLAPYGASKSFLTAFSEALTLEFASSPIKIICLCPSGMNTNFQKASGVKNEHPDRLLDPKWVAAKTLHLIESGFSGIKDLGFSTQVFKFMRAFLPYPIYSRVVGYLISHYR